jgi:cytosine/adenosine deaminase-related metal-dependent hydrolase
VHKLVAAGIPVGLGCDRSSSADSAPLWQEARNAMLLSRLRLGRIDLGRDSLGRGAR